MTSMSQVSDQCLARAHAAPFTCRILNQDQFRPPTGTGDPQDHEHAVLDSLAASYNFDNVLVAPTRLDIRFLRREFDLNRIHKVMKWLWLAGRPVPPRALHYQVLLGRNIVPCERIDLHLTWGRGNIFIKPLPRFLLMPEFWESSFLSDAGSLDTTPHRSLRECALGFLVSYTALIAYESDFFVAQEKHLIPPEVTWQNWKLLVRQVLTSSSNVQSEVADRFIYGELRLGRLNIIYFFLVSFLTTYLPRWNSYSDFYYDNLQLVIAATAYLVIFLTALQVGLGTDRLGHDASFQSVSYGMTVLAILGPLSGVAIIVLVFCVGFVLNWMWARNIERERQIILGRSWNA